MRRPSEIKVLTGVMKMPNPTRPDPVTRSKKPGGKYFYTVNSYYKNFSNFKISNPTRPDPARPDPARPGDPVKKTRHGENLSHNYDVRTQTFNIWGNVETQLLNLSEHYTSLFFSLCVCVFFL